MRRLCDCDLHKKQRQKGKNSGLHQAHKELKRHKRDRDERRGKKHNDRNKYRTCENVPEKTKGKWNKPDALWKQLNDTKQKSAYWMKVDEATRIFEKTNYKNARKFDGEKRDECERQGNVKISTWGAE